MCFGKFRSCRVKIPCEPGSRENAVKLGNCCCPGDQRPDLLLLLKGAVIHTEADIKWLDACLEEIASLQPYTAESDKEHST